MGLITNNLTGERELDLFVSEVLIMANAKDLLAQYGLLGGSGDVVDGGVVSGIGAEEWWGRYGELLDAIDFEIDESKGGREQDRVAWLRLKKEVLEMGAKVGGLYKDREVPVTIDKMLVVVSDRANQVLERYN